MAEIHNLKELNKLGRNLKYEDCIYFTTKDDIIKYKVFHCHLYVSTPTTLWNNFIFEYLGLNEKEKYELAEKYYGYKAAQGLWPLYKENDFQAAERLIREIYKKLEGSSNLDPSQFIQSRFEILDL